MKYLNVLLKPASKRCNINCKYCFYVDVSSHRDVEDYKIMKWDTAKNIIDKAFGDEELEAVTFGFQGGEPTLAGIEFFQKFFSYVAEKNVNNRVKVNYGLQTNATLLDEKWAKLLKENNVLVGVSLDGPAKFHNKNRVDFQDRETHKRVLDGIEILKAQDVDFNILTVVTNDHAKNIEKVYKYLVDQGFEHLQFIPCIDPIDFKVKNIKAANKLYTEYLNNLYKVWSKDLRSGKYISVRFFDNMLTMLNGGSPEACDMRGICSIQNIIEADGTVFCCDFYATDDYVIGNINDGTYEQFFKTDVARKFVEESMDVPDKCKSCKWYSLCRNGCKRNRIDGLNMHCESLRTFYNKNEKDIARLRFDVGRLIQEGIIK